MGGLVSTNAGGTAVLRYGTMRDLVLGLEAVLPNGEVWNGLKRLRKDNTGYDLKQLLIGAEGTLGVVTAATLKLFPLLASRAVAFAAVGTVADAIRLLARAKAETGGAVEAFELIGRLGVELAVRHLPGAREPLESRPPWYVLIETAEPVAGAAEAALERLLAGALADGPDHRRRRGPERGPGQGLLGPARGPVGGPEARGRRPGSTTSRCRSRASAISSKRPGGGALRPACADRRLRPRRRRQHPLRRPGAAGGDAAAHVAGRDAGARIVHDLVASLGGSISAEHGLGTMKTAEALAYKSPVEVQALRAIRAALDPKRIMNPRVLFWRKAPWPMRRSI